MDNIVGLYPGTFDPITLGHTDIIRRASRLCDHLIVGVAANAGKGPLFTMEERCEIAREAVADFEADARGKITVEPFDELLMNFAEKRNAKMIIRGLRAVSDFEYEFQMVGMNAALNDRIDTVFLMADVEYQAIASKLVKEIARLGGEISSFVPPNVVPRLKAKFAAKA